MSEQRLISPLLDNFVVGDPICEHDGVQCCPAIKKDTDEKFIVKIISVPESQTQAEALLLSGAFSSNDAIVSYYKSLADGIVTEINILQKLAQLEGFISIEGYQVVPKEEGYGCDIYLLSRYFNTLHSLLRKTPMTRMKALNLGLDLCAALSVSRRMGYIYADLKPANIYLNESQEFRIGDLGFINLNSLQYASLPERYNSEYTPPEISDAYSKLNQTVDIYAIGLILYQVFNNGQLPDTTKGTLPAPAYADGEMAKIILKACAEDPAERWQDPVDLGQALVNYMQCTGTADTPIIPTNSAVVIPCSDEGLFENNVGNSIAFATTGELHSEGFITESAIYHEDSEGNLTLIEDAMTGITDNVNVNYDEVTDEVSDILAQVDELIAHEAPSPVVQPEPIDVPIPQIIVPETKEEPVRTTVSGEPKALVDNNSDNAESFEDADADDYYDDNDYEEEDIFIPVTRKRRYGWIIWLLIALIMGTLTIGGFWGYKNYYLQNIDDLVLTLEDGGTLIVRIATETDEKDLIISCTDIYGNTRKSPVLDGTARFTGLIADSRYNITVSISGFHKLTGKTTASIGTPAETKITQLSAITGKLDGNVILSFEIEGPDSEQWKVVYKNKNGVEDSLEFTGHTVTLKGLTVGQEYTFTISPVTQLNLFGTSSIKYVARAVVRAKNIEITGCYDNNLCVSWTTDPGVNVDNWFVRCYNETFETTLIVKTTDAIIKIPNDADGYIVEITANDMTAASTFPLPKGTTTITDFTITETVDGSIKLKWTAGGAVPANGLILSYTVDGLGPISHVITDGNTLTISPIVPGGTYNFEITSTNNVPVIINTDKKFTHAVQLKQFDLLPGTGVSAENLEFAPCLTPEAENWRELPDEEMDFRTTFISGEKASIIAKIDTVCQLVEKTIDTVFVVRNEAGEVIDVSSGSEQWNVLVVDNQFKLDIPVMPSVPGNYTVSVFINNGLAYTTAITISDTVNP